MTQLHIDSAQLSKSGKSYAIMAGGVKYYAKPEQGIQGHIGDVLDCEIATSDYQGTTMLWLNAFKVVSSVPQAPQTPVPYNPSAPAGKVYSASPQAPVWLPMSSNCVAQAILAGHITKPEQIREWVFSVKAAVESAASDDVAF